MCGCCEWTEELSEVGIQVSFKASRGTIIPY